MRKIFFSGGDLGASQRTYQEHTYDLVGHFVINFTPHKNDALSSQPLVDIYPFSASTSRHAISDLGDADGHHGHASRLTASGHWPRLLSHYLLFVRNRSRATDNTAASRPEAKRRGQQGYQGRQKQTTRQHLYFFN